MFKVRTSFARQELVGSLLQKEVEDFNAFQMGDGDVWRLDIHSEAEAMGVRELEIVKMVEGMHGLHDVGGKGLYNRNQNRVKV